jgi:hypothetical protein
MTHKPVANWRRQDAFWKQKGDEMSIVVVLIAKE